MRTALYVSLLHARTRVREHMQAVDILGRRIRRAAHDGLGRRAVRQALLRRNNQRAAADAADAIAAKIASRHHAVRYSAR